MISAPFRRKNPPKRQIYPCPDIYEIGEKTLK
jgi:hypothetical protein